MFREELLWNKDNTKQPIVIEEVTYPITGIAEKCGLKILALQIDEIPSSDIRKKIDTQIRKLFYYYILILYNADRQVWLVPTQKNDKRELVTVAFAANQDTEFLYQKVTQLSYSLNDEETLTIVDVSKKVNDVFSVNAEKITTEFYKQFSIQHKAFRAFIEGIDTEVNKDWYASLMLNRLMFCYFIQKKRFLDNNINYLREKLKQVQALNTKNKKEGTAFYGFYKDFLLTLFHEGLGLPNNLKHKDLVGKIPYLNGGLFDTHELETIYGSKINISNKAFEKIFDFFDQYEWHLDTSITATGKDINPDVIGYIFEKYINDRAQMGAYYTKEDITAYISKNCILPFLFDETNRLIKTETIDIATITKTSGDAYIYDAVKKGTQIPLPTKVEKGIKTVADRTEWNKPAAEQYALPTEIWRETIERRNRYNTVNTKLQNGEVNTINDFITYNLNIQGFTKHFLETTTNPQHIKCFYQALNSVTILDPTCGSGAFLFAAMNILEPLYELCITRMEAFVHTSKKGKYKFFEATLNIIKSPQHPNLQYYIYKTIILRNLYGVDIMKEAVEIAKLRLFLKLVATVDANFSKPNYGLEPLPDIDFNIRAGNTLVGFATEAELKTGLKWQLNFGNEETEINEKCDIVAKAYSHYKTIQLTYGDNYTQFKTAKDALNLRLKELNQQLNKLLHMQATAYKYNDWLASHQPFHWFAEFYEIINGNGGFDVVIGNPPYVEYAKVKKDYVLKNYLTEKCGNLYAYVMERTINLTNRKSTIGFIVPISITTTPRMDKLNKLYENGYCWISNFAVFPQSLFADVHQRISIVILKKSDYKSMYTTKYNKWFGEERENVINNLSYSKSIKGYLKLNNKIGDSISLNIVNTINKQLKTTLMLESFSNNYCLYYKNTGVNSWLVFSSFAPKCKINGIEMPSSRETHFYVQTKKDLCILSALLNSSVFYLFYTFNTNCRDLNPTDVKSFNFPESLFNENFEALFKTLDKNHRINSKPLIRNQKQTGIVEIQSFRPRLSKPIIDEIDKVLARHYGFTDEELDFIINYDIKYRMGKGLEAAEDA